LAKAIVLGNRIPQERTVQRHLVTVALAAIAAGPGFSVAASADEVDVHTRLHVSASEIDAAVSQMGSSPVTDTVLRVVPIGTGIVGGSRQRVQPGDVLIIPPGTPHGFVEIDGKRIVYTLVRIDRDRVLEVASPAAQ
jgi:hypothetical protein